MYILSIFIHVNIREVSLIFATFGQNTYKSVKIISLVSMWPIKGTIDS